MLWTNKGCHKGHMVPHGHDMHELFFCLNDGGIQNIGGRSCDFLRGRAFFLYSGIVHQIEHRNQDESGDFVFFCFDPSHFIDCGMPEIQRQIQRGIAGRLFFSGIASDYLDFNLKTALALHEEMNAGGLLSSEMVKSMLAMLVINFFRSVGLEQKKDNDDSDDARIASLCALINENPALEFSLDSAASKCGMSRAKFTRSFKAGTGMSFCEFVNDLRLKKACDFLSDEAVSVGEAAFRTGFRNLGYFHRTFKEKFSYTPYQVKQIYRESAYPRFLKEKRTGG